MSAAPPATMRQPVAGEAAERLGQILGGQATIAFANDVTVIEPHNENACARALAACSANRWRTAVVGNGRWLPEPAASTVRVSTARMHAIPDIRPADLYATVQAGANIEDLANELGRHAVWLPIDPPGLNRSVGSLLGCATQGALRTGFGGVRDHVLGLTVITGNGRILRLGGRVVKNVAGFDLAKLVIGGFGAYGIVTAAHLKLRAQPSREATVQIRGEQPRLLEAAAAILAVGMTPAALQLTTDASGGALTARVAGSAELVEAEMAGVRDACPDGFEEMSVSEAETWWRGRRSNATTSPVTIRIGTPPTGVARALEITDEYSGTRGVTFGFGGATLRWNGQADVADLQRMRQLATREGMPLVVERAPATILAAVGHYGSLPKDSVHLAHSLQQVFDPAGILSGAIWGA